ncbi:MAG: hypothetical protein Q8R40_03170 [bacterium]|nr:hypothetical protein [bacterium]
MLPTNQLKMQNPNKVKLVVISVSVALLLLVAAFLFFNRSPIPSYHISLSPEEAIFNVAPAQARTNICGAMSGSFYDQICDSKFDNISKNDDEKLVQLFSLIQNVKEDNTISDYDRYYLANLLLVSLPTKDSSISSVSELLKIAGELIQRAAGVVAFAQESTPNTNTRNFDEQMARDIVSTVYDLPKGDNAWVINIMVSKYAWVDGRRDPIYSEQYTESFNPFPANSSVMPENITYHLKSFVNSQSVGIDESRPNIHEGTSVMMAYSFTIQSWHSQGAGHDDAVPETNLISRKNFSEKEYDGTGHTDELLAILERVEQNPSSNKMAQRRNDALDARKNYKKSAKEEETSEITPSSKDTTPKSPPIKDVTPTSLPTPPVDSDDVIVPNTTAPVDTDACQNEYSVSRSKCIEDNKVCNTACGENYDCNLACNLETNSCEDAATDRQRKCLGVWPYDRSTD